MTIRRLQKKDKEILLTLIAEFYDSDAVLAPVDPAYHKATYDVCISDSPIAEGFIFECGGEVVGYAVTTRSYSCEAGGEIVWIEEVYVRENYRGQGAGAQFFETLRTAYPNARRFRLEVEEENEKAIRFYKRLGYDFLDYKQMILDVK